jgi:hypothetical protein
LPRRDRCGKIGAGQNAVQPQLALRTSPEGMPMAKPQTFRADGTPGPARAIAVRVARQAPPVFGSSKHDGARATIALHRDHRTPRTAPCGTMPTGFETAEALQRCQPAADDDAAPNDAFIELAPHPDNDPVQATA